MAFFKSLHFLTSKHALTRLTPPLLEVRMGKNCPSKRAATALGAAVAAKVAAEVCVCHTCSGYILFVVVKHAVCVVIGASYFPVSSLLLLWLILPFACFAIALFLDGTI